MLDRSHAWLYWFEPVMEPRDSIVSLGFLRVSGALEPRRSQWIH